jgi:formylglycine-generating enzyme
MRRSAVTVWISIAVAATGAIALVVQLATRERRAPTRCPEGLISQGARCCAPGQRVEADRCVGEPERCPHGMRVVPKPMVGCSLEPRRVRLSGGRLSAAPRDWEGEPAAEPRAAPIGAFELDAAELTNERARAAEGEPGVPHTNLTPEDAERVCASFGGRLPSRDQWLLAAAGNAEPRRFAWGQTGLVCRRAVFGLVAGPCANGAAGPELAGARPDGKTPEGLLDLAGNVAEWTREPDGSYRARGGSFRSRVAGELKSFAAEPMPPERRAPHIGFRCAYAIE